jgi:hypothetical protein
LANNPSTRFVIGAEANFPGLRTIQRNFDDALDRPFKIYSNMKELVHKALDIAFRDVTAVA